MPVLNQRGDVISGFGGEQGALNGAYYPFQSYGSGDWLTDNLIIVNGRDNTLKIFDSTTKQTTAVPNSLEVNTLMAGGNNWLAHRAGMGVLGEVAGQRIGPFAAKGLAAVGRDGVYALVPDYASGLGLEIYDAQGNLVDTLPSGYYVDPQLLGGNRFIATDFPGGNVITHNYPVPTTIGTRHYHPRVATLNGEDWIVYEVDTLGVVLHAYNDPTRGAYFPKYTSGNAYRQDLTVVNGKLVVVFSSTQGERPEDIVRVEFLPSDLSTNLRTVYGITIAPFTQAMWTGYFYQWSDQYGDNPSAPGTTSVLVELEARKRCPRPAIVGILAMVPELWDKTVAVWVSGATVDGVESQARIALDKMTSLGVARRPIIGYLDKREWDRVPQGVNWFGVQAYCRKGESFDDFERSVRAEMAKLPGRVALHGQSYDTNDALTKDLVGVQAPIQRLAASPQVIATLWFSDGRSNPALGQGGARVHPELYPIHTAFVKAVPGTPAIEVIPTPASNTNPTVTIVSYATQVTEGDGARAVAKITSGTATRLQWLVRKQGASSWSVAADNPADDLDHTYQLSVGTWEIALRVQPGGAQTGALRTITVVAKPPIDPPTDPVDPPPSDPVDPPVDPVKPPVLPPVKKLTWWQKFLRSLGIK